MLIIDCDFHARFQQIAMLNPETGELEERQLRHEDDEARAFYQGLPEPALVGIESTSYTLWFVEMLRELGHKLVVGDAAKIRSMVVHKQKYDRQDALHLMNLLVRGDFPRIWVPSPEERDTRVLLHYRHHLVEMRTRVKNGLQAIGLSYGLYRLRRKLRTASSLEQLRQVTLREGLARRRADLLALLAQLDKCVKELDHRLRQEAERREEAKRLMTHPGVGPLTALAAVLILGPVERFQNGKQVASYVGLIPAETSSGGRQQFGRLTKQGNRLLRYLLVEAAHSAWRYDEDLDHCYRRLAFRKGISKAQVAVARKLAIRLYVMLRDGIDYSEFRRRASHAGRPERRVV